MQQTDNIELKPIIEPAPVPFTFDAVGWKILFMMLVVLAIYIVYKYYLHYKKNQYRRDAISKILEISLNTENSMSEFIKQTMFQIKLTALVTFGRNKVAALEGENWLSFLNETGKNANFKKHQVTILNAVYKDEYVENKKFDKDEFSNTSIKWIKSHAR